MAESPEIKVDGFQDFVNSSKTASRRKRHLPIAPRKRDRASSQDDPEGEHCRCHSSVSLEHACRYAVHSITHQSECTHTHTHTPDDMLFLGTTPANRPDPPEYGGAHQAQFAANLRSFHEEQQEEEVEEEEDEERTTR